MRAEVESCFFAPGYPNRYAANMFRSIFRKLTGADSAIDSIVARDPAAISSEDHDIVYKAGCDLISPYMPLHNHESRAANSPGVQRNVRRGIELLTFVTKANPANWNAHWVIGKGHQALGDSNAACDSFRASFDIEKENPDVAREYMFECLNLGRGSDGVSAARHAVSLEPNNAGLHANMALAFLVDGQLDNADAAASKSLQLDPSDQITQRVQMMVKHVRSGKKPQPHCMADLQ